MIKNSRTLGVSAAFAASLLAASCGQGDTTGADNEGVESVAERVAEIDHRPMPGRWESQMTIEKIEVPGLPPEAKDMMKQHMGKLGSTASCLTEEEAANVDGEFFKPESQSGCTYNNFSMGGGKIDASLTCEDGAMSQTMTMQGEYSEESYAMRITSDGTVQGQPMSMAMTIESRHVGECNGKETS